MNEIIFDFYSKPTQIGGELPFFAGERFNQIGGGFLGNIGRFLLPILKTLGKHVLGIGLETAHDYVNKDRPIGESLIKNAEKRMQKGQGGYKKIVSEPITWSKNASTHQGYQPLVNEELQLNWPKKKKKKSIITYIRDKFTKTNGQKGKRVKKGRVSKKSINKDDVFHKHNIQ